MATRIRGVTIEIGGDTSPLAKALKNVNGEISDTQRQLKDVEKLLKLDPGNTEALAQKQRLLNDSVEEHRRKLETVKNVQEELNRTIKEGGQVNQKQLDAVNREVEFLTQGLKNAEKEAKGFNATIEKAALSAKNTGDKLTGAANALKPLSAVGAAAGIGMFALAKNAGIAADDINTLAKQTGLTTEEIQKFIYASDIIDVSLETLTGSMAKLVRNMNTARKGTGDAAEAFKALRVNFQNADGTLRNNQDVFDDVIKALSRVKNETERDALAMTLFGRSAQDLNPLILGGADTLRKLGDEAKRAGLVLSQEALDGANEFNDELSNLKTTAAATTKEIGAELAAALLPLLKEIAPIIKDFLTWMRSLDGDTLKMITTIALAVAALAPLLMILGQIAFGVNQLLLLMPALGGAFSAISGIAGTLIASLGGVAASIGAIPLAIIAVVVGIAVFGDEIQEVLQGIDDFLQGVFLTDWTETFGQAGEILNRMFANLKNVWDSIKTFLDGVIDVIRGIITLDLQRVMDGAVKIFKGAFQSILTAVLAPVNMIIAAVNFLIDSMNSVLKFVNNIKLPDFLGGGKLFDFKLIGKLDYLDAKKITDNMGKALTGVTSKAGSAVSKTRIEQQARSTGNTYINMQVSAEDMQSVADFYRTAQNAKRLGRMANG